MLAATPLHPDRAPRADASERHCAPLANAPLPGIYRQKRTAVLSPYSAPADAGSPGAMRRFDGLRRDPVETAESDQILDFLDSPCLWPRLAVGMPDPGARASRKGDGRAAVDPALPVRADRRSADESRPRLERSVTSPARVAGCQPLRRIARARAWPARSCYNRRGRAGAAGPARQLDDRPIHSCDRDCGARRTP